MSRSKNEVVRRGVVLKRLAKLLDDLDGSPYAGLVVRVAGKSLEAVTDAQGKVRFEGLPAGQKVSLVYSQPFSVHDREHRVVASEMLLEDAASVTIPKGEVQLSAQVKAGLHAGAGCNTTPWAFVSVTTGSDLAPFIAKGSTGPAPAERLRRPTLVLSLAPVPSSTVQARHRLRRPGR